MPLLLAQFSQTPALPVDPAAALAVLDARLTQLQIGQSGMMSTALWTMTMMALLVLAVSVLVWFITWRQGQREADALRHELRGLFDQESAFQRGELTRKIQETQEKLTQVVKRHATTTDKEIEAAVDEVRDRVTRDMDEMRLRLAQLDAWQWRSRNQPGQELTAQFNVARQAQGLGHDYMVSAALVEVLRLMKSGAQITEEEWPNVDKFLGDLPMSLDSVRMNIRDLFRKRRAGAPV